MKHIKKFIDLKTVIKKFQEEVIGTSTPAEALYGFGGWLTSLEDPVIASAYHDASVWADLVSEFCIANGLDFIRDDWTDYLTFPTTRELFK